MPGTDPAARPCYQGRPAVARSRGITPDLLAHRMRRHPAGLPDPAVANFTASVISFGCAWSGDVRETAAWHAEQPGRSGWWDALAP
jgi:hypothetical protein